MTNAVKFVSVTWSAKLEFYQVGGRGMRNAIPALEV